jgi:hypothetical protein
MMPTVSENTGSQRYSVTGPLGVSCTTYSAQTLVRM